MLRPRIIPCLLVHKKGLVKTVQFGNPKYVGDPINAVRIFNEKFVDELMVLDIDATVENREPDYQLIEYLAAECRMPLTYGGGVRTPEQAQRIFSLGVEKVAMSASILSDLSLVSRIAAQVGTQSVVAVLDIRRHKKEFKIYTHNGTKAVNQSVSDVVKALEANGAGEIVVNSIDQDGVMKGYDLDLVRKVRNETTLPMTVLGGVGKLSDIGELIKEHGIIGAAAGSLFVFKGVYKAVLINYPTMSEKELLIQANLKKGQ